MSVADQIIAIQKEELDEALEKIKSLTNAEEERIGVRRRENEMEQLKQMHMRPLYEKETLEKEIKSSLVNLDYELANPERRLESSTIDQFFYNLSLKDNRIKCISSIAFCHGIDLIEGTREYYAKSIKLLEEEKLDFILAPRLVEGDHWCLLVFQKGEVFSMFDPKYSSQKYDEVFKHLFALFAVEKPLDGNIRSCLSRLQCLEDDYSCGPWICKYAELLAESKKKPNMKMLRDQKKELVEFRKKLIKDCMESIQGPFSVLKSLNQD